MRNIASHTLVSKKKNPREFHAQMPPFKHMLGDPMDAIRSQRKIKTEVVHNDNIIFTYILFIYNSNLCEKNSLDNKQNKT